jgi:anti-sigma B factor antagonist
LPLGAAVLAEGGVIPESIITSTVEADGVRIACTVDEIDVSNAGILRDELSRAVADGARWVTVDLSGVTFLDSSGAGALVVAHNEAIVAGCDLTVDRVRPQVMKVLRILGLSDVMNIRPLEE